MNNRKKIALLCGALAVFFLLVGAFALIWVKNQPDPYAGQKSFSFIVVHSDGTAKDFIIYTDREFLADALLDEKLIVESDSPGMYITVDGENADYSVNQSYWAFFVGDDYAMEGMNTTVITDGACYKLVYTIG